LPRGRLWRRFRIAMPPAAGLARFDHRVDVTQAAVVVCALLAGRAFGPDEYPRDLEALVGEGVRRATAGARRDDRDRLTWWLRAGTEFESRSAFSSAAAARAALRAAFSTDLDDDAAVRRWLLASRGIALPPVAVVPIPLAQPPEPVGPEPVEMVAEAVGAGVEPARGGDEHPNSSAMSRVRRWISAR
jgi:hypothetical protein